MPHISATRVIAADAAAVFDAVAHIEKFKEVVPHITKVEFLTEQKRGVGTKFKETRLMGKREGTTELEVTEYVPDERIRLVSDAGGTIWDTLFTVQPHERGCELRMQMDARPYKLAAKLSTKMIMGFVQKAVEADMDMVKQHCERG